MPDEPNKKMDELLRAYAEERRKAPEVPLHPATRNNLRAEVQRVFGFRHPRTWWHELRSWWPQIAFGGSMCLILGIAILSLRHTPPATQEQSRVAPQVNESLERAPELLMKQKADATTSDASKTRSEPDGLSPGTPSTSINNSSTPAPETQRGVARGPVFDLNSERVLADPASAEAEVLRDENGINPTGVEQRQFRITSSAAPKEAQVTLQQKFESALKEQDAITDTRNESPVATSARIDSEASTRKSNIPSAARPAARTSSPAPSIAGSAVITPEKLSLAAEMTNLGAERRMTFVRTTNTLAPAGSPTPVNAPVLTSFQVEQLGTNLQFYDQDGSVYLGSIKPTNTLSILGKQITTPSDEAVINNSAAYFFQVQGTNRTLGREVVLSGNYFEKTNRQPSSLDTFSIAPKARPQPQPRYLIIGNATVGETNQVPLRAISNEP